MTEEEFRVSIGAYLLGALEPGETLELQEHLRDCADCQKEYLELTEVLPALAALPADLDAVEEFNPADERVLRRALRRIESEERRARRRPWLAAAAVVAAAAVLTVAVPVGLTTLSGHSTAPAATEAIEQTSPGPPPELRTVTGTNALTGAALIATLRGDGTGTQIQAQLTGARPGMVCRLAAISRSDAQQVAGSAPVGAPTPDGGTSTGITGTVTFPMDQVGKIRVLDSENQVLVEIRL